MLNKLKSVGLSSLKIIYLVFFFAFLAGIFYPFITETSFDVVISGVAILFLGLVGGFLLYKAGTSNNKREIYLGMGSALLIISLAIISEISGRPIF